MSAELSNLRHVLYDGPCTDADCELHNPDVGVREETVSATNLAFFLAGAQVLAMSQTTGREGNFRDINGFALDLYDEMSAPKQGG